MRRFLIANSAWEGTFAAARSFVILYVIEGLHESQTVSGEILAAVAGGYVVAALFSGRLGDRFGLARVIFFASFVYGTGFLVGGLAQEWHSWYLGLIGVVSIAGGTVMTLAWGLLYKIVPEQHRGAASGLATTTKGIGLLVGAPLAGLAIDVSKPYLERDGRLPDPVAGLRPRDPRRDPAAGAADGGRARRAGREAPVCEALQPVRRRVGARAGAGRDLAGDAMLGPLLGATMRGATVYELPPGQTSLPYFAVEDGAAPRSAIEYVLQNPVGPASASKRATGTGRRG